MTKSRAEYIGPGPCEFYQCPLAAKCKSEQLACESFAAYIAKGRVIDPYLEIKRTGKSGRIMQTGERKVPVPTRKLHDAIYNSRKAA